MTVDLALRGGTLRAPALGSTLLRCALYLGPLSVAVAAARPLSRVAWPVPIGTLLLGWSVAHAVAGVGALVARRSGRGPAARLVALAFAAAAAVWVAVVGVAPAGLVGPGRLPAVAVGLCGLLSLGTVTAALVTRTEAAVVRWSLPCWLLAAVSIAGTVGDTLAQRVPVTLLLPIVVGIAAARAFRPAFGASPVGRLRPGDLRHGAVRLLLGAAQATCVALLWRAGPPTATSPAVLPLLAAGPVLEALIGWHRRQVDAGLDAAESDEEFRTHLGGVTVVTVAALVPPLAAGIAVAVAAYRLPVGTAGVLEFAGGILLSGVLAITLLLGWRGRTGVATLLAAAPPAAALAVPLVPALPPDPLPTVVVILAATHLAGLLLVARTAADPRRMS
ncbi:hypothetical protein [Pseudosporangium ferrugineum]|uniref:Uncharacterized protein n=1 Tax=Pseudosporangium ferrugineum TaxID=439699 RepID=A0A2T0SCP1_9ACTN|nr:hypothetical protein [Pseudosporangium ferrugineum]PRY31195.1 hypothetical protein CLV70_10379 [Pseudosporangium ferrugineum]